MVLNTTFNDISVISCQSVLLLEETGVPGENHRPVTSRWQTLSHNVWFRQVWPYCITSTWKFKSELVSDCCYLILRTSYISMGWWYDVCFVLEQLKYLDINSANSQEQQCTCRHVSPRKHIITYFIEITPNLHV
jgi:hypothetical protein